MIMKKYFRVVLSIFLSCPRTNRGLSIVRHPPPLSSQGSTKFHRTRQMTKAVSLCLSFQVNKHLPKYQERNPPTLLNIKNFGGRNERRKDWLDLTIKWNMEMSIAPKMNLMIKSRFTSAQTQKILIINSHSYLTKYL